MIALGLGSNLGNRAENIMNALNCLCANYPITLLQVSSLYETAPVGFLNQPSFLNAVAEIQTLLDPLSLLEACLQTEKLLGRIRDIKWGPRSIDIDLLLYHAIRLESEALTLPHPFLHERRFVLEPLLEIAQDAMLVDGQTAAQMLTQLEDKAEVKFYGKLLLQGGKVQLDETD